MTKDVAGGVKAIEAEAEQILKDARAKADKIVFEAKQEASKILSSELPMDEVKVECGKIISAAQRQADKEIENSGKKASGIDSNASKKTESIVKLIASIVTGTKPT
jgi:F0F1-type ATP synthase membrane subunit b/b'